MKFSVGVIIFFVALIALVAECVLYFFMGISLAFAGGAGSTEAISFFAAFFLWLMFMTVAAGVSAPICGAVENLSKKPNIGMYGFLGVLAVAGIGTAILMVVTYAARVTSNGSLSGSTAAKNSWRIVESKSQMDSSRAVTARLNAENEVKGWLGTKQAQLVVACEEGKVNAYADVGTSASVESGRYHQHTVRIRFDEEKPIQQRWSESTEGHALFAPNGLALAEQVAKAKVMLFEFTPFNASTVTLRFNVAGFDQHIGKVKEACARKP